MSSSTLQPIKIIIAIVIVCLFNVNGNAQNARDIVIKDSVQSILNTDLIRQKADYLKVKSIIIKLEKQYGYETNLKKRLLEAAYEHNDFDFFKQEIAILVKDHGFDVAYLRESENYFTAIMSGSLSAWFKAMYLKNHTIWLDKNFDKQIELRKLNTINEKDQSLTAFAMNVLNVPGLDTLQQKEIKDLLGTYHLKNIEPLTAIATKRKIFANEKNFAVLQNGYDSALIHNFQFKDNMEHVWELLFPYIKASYLKFEITNVLFQNYDFYHYQHYGTQVFDSYTIDQIPEQFRKNNEPIPVKDIVWLKKIKKEFKWPD